MLATTMFNASHHVNAVYQPISWCVEIFENTTLIWLHVRKRVSLVWSFMKSCLKHLL